MNRAQTLSGDICLAIAAPAIESAEFHAIQYVLLFLNHEQPAVERWTRTPWKT